MQQLTFHLVLPDVFAKYATTKLVEFSGSPLVQTNRLQILLYGIYRLALFFAGRLHQDYYASRWKTKVPHKSSNISWFSKKGMTSLRIRRYQGIITCVISTVGVPEELSGCLEELCVRLVMFSHHVHLVMFSHQQPHKLLRIHNFKEF